MTTSRSTYHERQNAEHRVGDDAKAVILNGRLDGGGAGELTMSAANTFTLHGIRPDASAYVLLLEYLVEVRAGGASGRYTTIPQNINRVGYIRIWNSALSHSLYVTVDGQHGIDGRLLKKDRGANFETFERIRIWNPFGNPVTFVYVEEYGAPV